MTPSTPTAPPYRRLYRFRWDCGRQGEIEGLFAAAPATVESALGAEVYFGEVLGKHSEIYGTLQAADLEVLTDDQEFIRKANEYGLLPAGYNPLEYLC